MIHLILWIAMDCVECRLFGLPLEFVLLIFPSLDRRTDIWSNASLTSSKQRVALSHKRRRYASSSGECTCDRGQSWTACSLLRNSSTAKHDSCRARSFSGAVLIAFRTSLTFWKTVKPKETIPMMALAGSIRYDRVLTWGDTDLICYTMLKKTSSVSKTTKGSAHTYAHPIDDVSGGAEISFDTYAVTVRTTKRCAPPGSWELRLSLDRSLTFWQAVATGCKIWYSYQT